jgi:hypothetical protein
MTEKDLGRALLDLDSSKLAETPATREQTWRILDSDRRRVRRWTIVTVTLWAAALLMVLLMLVAYGLVFPLQAKLAQHELAERAAAAPGAAPAEPGQRTTERELIDLDHLTPDQRELAKFKAQIAFQMVTVGVTCSVGILALAALSTVFLVLNSRRATLRQINASLLEISNQLKELRQAGSKPA